MIHFLCNCGEPFDVPTELAGDSLQCPACKRLVDVPRLSDNGSLESDGTVRMAEAQDTPSALGDKLRAFGYVEDMRPSLDEFLLAGTGDAATTPPERPKPRYDPVTGELMLPVGIANDDFAPKPVIDPASPVLGYARTVPQASALPEPGSVTWWTLPWKLLTGMNIVAILVVFIAHAGICLPSLLPGFNILWIPIILFVLVMVLAHYCNVMEDFGPNDRGRVPPLLRSASFSEDIFHPLVHLGTAVFYAFGPLILTAIFAPSGTFRSYPAVWFALLSWGMLIFPLAAFTTVCGGVVHNLAPKRLLSVVTAAPAKMGIAIVAFWIGLFAYLLAFSSMSWSDATALQMQQVTRTEFLRFLLSLSLTFGLFAIAVYLMHLASAWMGLTYRAHYHDFDWVLQRHERVSRDDVMAQLLKRRGLPGQTAQPDPMELRKLRQVDAQQNRPRKHSGFEVKL